MRRDVPVRRLDAGFMDPSDPNNLTSARLFHVPSTPSYPVLQGEEGRSRLLPRFLTEFDPRILQQQPFKFLVGPERTTFFLHPALVAKYSTPLHKLMSGWMGEAQDGCAVLDDVEPETFARFSTYLYTKGYAAAKHSIDTDSNASEKNGFDDTFSEAGTLMRSPQSISGESIDSAFVEPLDLTRSSWPGRDDLERRRSSYRTKRDAAWNGFKINNYRLNTGKFPPFITRPNEDASEDYTEVFLSHAQLYVFADRYDVRDLRLLAVGRLHRALAEFTLYNERAGDIITLLRYTYDNTPELSGRQDELRGMVIAYVSCHLERLRQHGAFADMLHAEGSFSKDLLDALARRLD